MIALKWFPFWGNKWLPYFQVQKSIKAEAEHWKVCGSEQAKRARGISLPKQTISGNVADIFFATEQVSCVSAKGTTFMNGSQGEKIKATSQCPDWWDSKGQPQGGSSSSSSSSKSALRKVAQSNTRKGSLSAMVQWLILNLHATLHTYLSIGTNKDVIIRKTRSTCRCFPSKIVIFQKLDVPHMLLLKNLADTKLLVFGMSECVVTTALL